MRSISWRSFRLTDIFAIEQFFPHNPCKNALVPVICDMKVSGRDGGVLCRHWKRKLPEMHANNARGQGMESAAPISDMITGLTLYCRLVEDIIEGETELTLTEYRMLFFLSMTPDKRARIHTLAEALYLSASTISDAAKNLEALGFIEKADSRNDLKAVWAVVTKDGERELGRCTTALVEYSQEYWSLIGPQTTQIYLSSGAKLIEHSNYPIQAALELPGQAFYPFVTRIYLLSAVSWFKSTYNLSLLDARILMLLLERGTVLTCAEISHLLKVSNSAVSNAVRSLSRVKHYVEREKVAGSGKIKVQLTEEGVSTAQEIRERFITRYMKQFDVTREEFEEVLKAVHPRHRKSYMQKVFGESFAGI